MQNTTLPALPGMGAAQAPSNTAKSSVLPVLENLSVTELLDLRSRVSSALPAASLKDVNLADELVMQMLALQQAQQKALNDSDTPTNQVAQAMSALTNALSILVKLQVDAYNSERLKKIEQIFIECTEGLPAPMYEAFIAEYSSKLRF